MPAVVHRATRYVQPLREGGSLPAVVETDDGALWVVKFRGAGQGARALIAEIVVAGIARTLGLAVPDVALVDIPDEFGRIERDPEIQDLLRRSAGVNVALRYLDGAFNFDLTAAGDLVTTDFATRVVWLDALVTNPDRTARNPNILVWNRAPWLIDHGAALYAHHDWRGVDEPRTRAGFPLVRDHVLLERADDVAAMDAELAAALDADTIARIVDDVPDALLEDPSGPVGAGELATPDAARMRYVEYLTTRLRSPRAFVESVASAAAARRDAPPTRLRARR